MRYSTQPTARARINRDPSKRRAKDAAQIKVLYHRYLRMGFDASEARSKAEHHHTAKL